MTDQLRPAHGARFELDLLEEAGGGARYRARIHTSAATSGYLLSLSESGCEVAAEGPDEAPPWARAHLGMLGRQLLREARRDGAFRRRLLRWRDKGGE